MEKTIKERVLEILEEYGEFEGFAEFGFESLDYKEFNEKYKIPRIVRELEYDEGHKKEIVKYILEQEGYIK